METQPGTDPVSGSHTPYAPLQQKQQDLGSSNSMDSDENFICNICMEQATDSVVTPCGHIFCWWCLYKWVEVNAKPCPLCKVMVGLGSVIPVSGGRTTSCRFRESSIPPRPNPSSGTQSETVDDANIVLSPTFRDAVVTVRSSWMRETLSTMSLVEGLERDAHLETLRSAAREAFRAIRQSRPPPSTGWIAQASGSFDPSVNGSLGPDTGFSLSDFGSFNNYVDFLQSEYHPAPPDYMVSWWPYFKALNPGQLFFDLFGDFLSSWFKHLHGAWDRAGRPQFPSHAGGRRSTRAENYGSS